MEPVSPRTSLRRLAAALLLATIALAPLGACGGEEGDLDAEGLLDRAFRHSIESADLRIDAQLTLDGLKGFERPLRLEASGPYAAGGRGLPKLDVDVNLGVQGAGQTVQFGLLRTGDRAFVKFGGEFYEGSRRDVERANRELAAGRGGRGGSLRDLGLAPRTWVVNARDEGEERVAGVTTHHVSGRLDTRSLLRDLNELVRRSAGAVGAEAADAGDPLSGAELDELAETVREPSFDVYVGKDDETIRRLSAQLEVRVPEEDRGRAGGVESGALRFSIEFRDLDGDQEVRAPARARPLAALTRQLGGLRALGGAVLGGDRSRERDGREGSGTPRGGRAGAPEDGVEAFRRYSDCLDRAAPDDTSALSRCAELLR